MILFRLIATWVVTSASLSKSKYLPSAPREPTSFLACWSSATSLCLTNLESAMEARLHTAVSSLLVYSTISVHRLEDLIVPKFCWLDLPLHASLKSM